jgi:DNA adenine methylase
MALFKLTGAKLQHLNMLMAALPPADVFVEPFCGTAVVGMEMARSGRCGRLVLSDVNQRLIGMLMRVRDDAAALKAVIVAQGSRYNEAGEEQKGVYTEWAQWLNGEPGLQRDAAFLLANRTNFNGLYRENRQGQYNVSWGKRAAINVDLVVTEIQLAAQALNAVPTQISCAPYYAMEIEPGTVIFADPPYDGTFGAYNEVAWKPEQQADLSLFLRARARGGARVFTTNSDTPRIRALYHGCKMTSYSSRSSVSCDSATRGGRSELLIEVQS